MTTINIKDRATVVEAIAAYRKCQRAVAEQGEENGEFCDWLTTAFDITVDGETFAEVPTFLAPAVRAEAEAVAAQLETIGDELQAWLASLDPVTYDDSWLDVLDRHRTASELATAAGDSQLAEAHMWAALNVGPDGLGAEYETYAMRTAEMASLPEVLAGIVAVDAPHYLVRATSAVMERITGLGETVKAVQDAAQNLRYAADEWQRTAPTAAELNSAEDGDPERYRDLVVRRAAATTELFSSFRSAAEKVGQAQAA